MLEARGWRLDYILLSLIFLFLFTTNAYSQEFEACKPQDFESYKFKTYQHSKSLPQISGYNVNSYTLDLQIDPRVDSIKGSVNVFFTVSVDSLNQFQLLLSDSMQVDSVVYHSKSISFTHSSRIITASLDTFIIKDNTESIEVFYRGSPKPGGLGTFQQDTIPGGDQMIWTLSQPYGASEWWPCKDGLSDKVDSIEIKVTTPLAYRVAANGLRIGLDTINTNHRYHYKSNYSIATYLIAVAVGNYQFFEEKYAIGNDSLLIEHFLFPNETLQQSNDPLQAWIILFDSLFGEYPFMNEKYGHASFTRGGGMEHQTMSFMGGYGGELIAHELAHQWFGNKITCSSWQDLWLNEGFATYLTGLTYEFNSVHDSIYWPVVLRLWKKDVFQFPNEALFREDTTDVSDLFNPVVYQKGASFLHMLRWVCGDSAFFKGIQNYISDPALIYGYANTNDLKAHLESSSGKNLDEFFKDWFYGKGFPIYTSTWSQSNGNFNLTIEQTPSNPSVYFFNMPLPYQIHSGNWDSTIVFHPRFSGENFSVNLNRAVDSITFDPEGWILAKNDVLTGITSYQKANSIIIYPNPVNDYLNIDFESKADRVRIYDASMRKVIDQAYSKRIKVGQLPSGYYILQLNGKTNTFTTPFLKD